MMQSHLRLVILVNIIILKPQHSWDMTANLQKKKEE